MLIAILIAAAAPATAVPAASPPAPAASDGDASVLAAEQAITANQPDRARALLEPLAARPSGNRRHDNQVLFLLGLIDIAEQDYDAAIARFHRVLVTEPGQVRVRLELGRAYFMAKDYEDAQRQFLFARAGRLPKNVIDNVDHFLNAIRFLRTFTYNFALSVAEDSNLNAGPATDSVTLFGLPSQLPPSSVANAGVGLAFDGSLEWAPRVGKKVR
jgi:tetratricopeptide (TPR) repeat protein